MNGYVELMGEKADAYIIMSKNSEKKIHLGQVAAESGRIIFFLNLIGGRGLDLSGSRCGPVSSPL
jgi:hypothetical protein